MKQSKIFQYAKKHIEVTAQENGIISVSIGDDNLYLVMCSGKTYELSQREVEYQAEEYLKSELEDLRNSL